MSDRIITGAADIQTTGGINFSDIFKRMRENPVGTTTRSILSLSQFQAKAGDGWVLANGASYLTASYPELFAAIGYTYGGSGANFNIPNMQNRYTRMSGSSPVGTCLSNTTSTANLTLSPGSSGFSPLGASFSSIGGHYHSAGTLSSPIWFDYNKIDYNANTETSGPNITFPANSCAFVTGISNITVYRNFVNLRGQSGVTTCGTRTYRIQSTLPSLGGGDVETRPDTIVLNWFIRIK